MFAFTKTDKYQAVYKKNSNCNNLIQNLVKFILYIFIIVYKLKAINQHLGFYKIDKH